MSNMHYQATDEEKELFRVILSLSSEEDCENFLRDLLTEAELKEFSNRWKAARMLDEKVPYEKIEKETGMSTTTIARISKWLQKGMGGYRSMLDKQK